MRPLTKSWRGQGIKSVVFLDDGIAAQNTKKLTKNAAEKIESDLTRAGFTINKEKSDLIPKQKRKWLGVIIDTKSMSFYVPEEKIIKLKQEITKTLSQKTSTPKELAKLAGTLSSMHMAIGPSVRLFTRSMYRQIACAASWHQRILLTQGTIEQLSFWLENIEYVNGCTFKHRPTTTQMVFSDASQDGYGGFTVHKLQRLICSGKFTASEMKESSTYREILAVKLVLQSYGKMLNNQEIQINMDNFGATRILTIGSSKEPLQKLSMDIFFHCLQNNIKITCKWIPRELNYDADYLSKIGDTDSWGVDKDTFHYINRKFGPFSVDRFADDRNKKLKAFNSRYYCPGTAHVNTFTADWSDENNWLCPPVSLIGSTLKHLRLCKGRGTLLIPVWASAYFWPLIYPDGSHPAPFIKDVLVVDPYYESYGEDSAFNGHVTFQTIALQLQF